MSCLRRHAAAEGDGALLQGGLDRLLRALKSSGQLHQPLAPTSEDLEETEVLSLDDLLAEEERDSRRGDWDDAWETGGRLN